MSIFLNQRNDGSLALFIDGDLQFDQTDEHIYHEGLALPRFSFYTDGQRQTAN